MIDTINARADVRLADPVGAPGLWTVRATQDLVPVIQGIRTAPLQSKAIGMAIGQRFRDRIEAEQVERLHGSVPPRGYPQGTLPTGACGNEGSAERFWLVAMPAQSAEGS